MQLYLLRNTEMVSKRYHVNYRGFPVLHKLHYNHEGIYA